MILDEELGEILLQDNDPMQKKKIDQFKKLN